MARRAPHGRRAQATATGTAETLGGQRINLEFVCANPTGPSTPAADAGWRWGTPSPTCSPSQGADVHREYYLNDAGSQLDTFGASLLARYEGREPPGDGYFGDYLIEMADRMRAALGDERHRGGGPGVGLPRRRSASCTRTSTGSASTSTPGSRSAPSTSAATSPRVLDELGALGVTFEADGATWLRTTDHGDNRRPRARASPTASTTYLCNDLAYHRDKLARGWEHLIDIWGADHHGQVKSLQAGLAALGHPDEPEVLLGQLVKMVRDGEPVRMSRTRRRRSSRSPTSSTRSTPTCAGSPSCCRASTPPQTFDLDVVHRPVDGKSRVLRAVRPRPERCPSPGALPSPASTRLPILETNLAPLRRRARARPAPRPRHATRTWSPRRRRCARRTGSRPGCATSRRGSTASTATAGCSPTTPR